MSERSSSGEGSIPGAGRRKLRVLTDDCYPVVFNVEHGQRNARITQTKMALHAKTERWRSYNVSAVTLLRGWGQDLLHTINAVPIRSWKRFVVTFEDVMPRIWGDPAQSKMRERLTRVLLSRQCAAMVAMSEYATRKLRSHHHRDQSVADRLLRKTVVVYPSVPVRSDRVKTLDDRLRLLFVGNDFMRKGLPVVTRAHKALRARGVPVETTVVSGLCWSPDDYVGPRAGYDIEAEKVRLDQPGLTYHGKLPNEQVRELMTEAHFTLLPTIHDTFGYTPVESLSCGTPAVVTDTAALPEIVEDGVCGYLLPMDVNDWYGIRTWDWLGKLRQPEYDEAYKETCERLAEALVERLTGCWEDRGGYEALSVGAVKRFAQRFETTIARNALERIYERAR